MAILNINILNPRIDLIADNTGISNSCKTVYTFDILSVPGANITVTTQRVNSNVEDYDSLQYTNGGRFIDATANQSFVMNNQGKARFKVEIGNVDLLDAKNPNTVGQNCNKAKVTVVDSTNNKSESVELSRCINDDRCEVTTEPAPVEVTIDSQTNLRIYFDKSGSMDSTLAPLIAAKDGPLRTKLLSYYNNDVATYNSKVKIIEMATVGSLLYENPYSTLNYGGENLSGKVISLVFMDEADTFATTTDINQPSNPDHNEHLPVLRNRLGGFPANYYKGALFQVATPDTGGDMLAFKAYITAVRDGTGVYTGTNGLSDKPEIKIKLDITPASTAQYYTDLIIATLNELGFNIV